MANSLFLILNGAGGEIRTRDLNLGKVALYQLSYTRGMFLLFDSANITKWYFIVNRKVFFCKFSQLRIKRYSKWAEFFRAIPRLGIPRLPPRVESAYSRVAEPRRRECAVPGGRVVQGSLRLLPEGVH